MNANQLRSKFLEFFKSKGHAVIKSAPLIPDNDPTVLFTTAGMHPLVPFLLGAPHPLGKRLCDVQKCIRTGDIDEVGDPVHLTFFEMLGNWSLGDYFKETAIRNSFEFLTGKEWLNIPVERLAFTVFAGDENAPFDEEAFHLWRSLGVSEKRIAKLPKEDNWWGPAGQTGPCGPDTEMFYWTGPMPIPETFDPKDKRWVEIWNDVFMQYNKTAEGKFIPLEKRNVDTGMGVERVTAILQGKSSCYDTEIFAPLFAELDRIRGIETPAERTRSERIVVEHMRAATFILADGITPGKVDQPYILRRLIRRAIREAKQAGVTVPFTSRMAKIVIENYGDAYPELRENQTMILEELDREESLFKQTLEHDEAFRKHQELSRQGAEQKFKGGLADHSVETARLHTATHLLHKALRMVLGDHVAQKGSNINAERLRFDFSHPDKMTPEQIAEVERLVNEEINRNDPVICEEMSQEDARKSGAIGLFGNKYGERVTVYSMGDFSKEICGGPHASSTGELGSFKIIKEESSSRGVRRIKAVIGKKQ